MKKIFASLSILAAVVLGFSAPALGQQNSSVSTIDQFKASSTPLSIVSRIPGRDVYLPGSTVTAAYFVGNGSLLTGISVPTLSYPWTVGGGVIYHSTSTDKVGFGTTTPSAKVDIYGIAGLTNPFAISSSSNDRMVTVTSRGNIGVGTSTPQERLDLSGNLNMIAVSPPTAPTAALAGGGAGSLTNGTYNYKITFVTSPFGESQIGDISNTVTVTDATTNGKISLTNIPTGPQNANYITTARKIYRNKAGAQPFYYLVATISDNTTTTYADNTADASLVTQPVYGKKASGGIIYFTDPAWGKVPIISTVSNSSPFGPNQFYSTYVGWNAGNPTGDVGGNNTAIGSEALQSVTTGGGNIAIGARVLLPVTTGSSNIGIGPSACGNTSTGSRSICIGTNAGLSNTGDEALYIGHQAGQSANAFANTAVGTYSMLSGTTGGFSTAVGYYTFAFGNAGSNSTAMGFASGISASGNYFTGYGSNSGQSVTTGIGNTHIGKSAGHTDGTTATIGTLDNVTTLGYMAQVTQANSLILGGLSANGFGVKVGINTTAPSAKLHVIETTEQLRLGYDASNYWKTTISSIGSAVFDLVGTSPDFTFADVVKGVINAYGSGWNGSAKFATEDAIYDEIEAVKATIPAPGGSGVVFQNTGTINVVKGTLYQLNAFGADITATLPAGPATGDAIEITMAADGSYSVYIDDASASNVYTFGGVGVKVYIVWNGASWTVNGL